MSSNNRHSPTGDLYALILAGGTGTRLWPRSRRDMPKQLLDIVSENTMLQETCIRIEPLVPLERTFVITNDTYAPIIRQQVPRLPADNILVEPAGRGTATCIRPGTGATRITHIRNPRLSLSACAVPPDWSVSYRFNREPLRNYRGEFVVWSSRGGWFRSTRTSFPSSMPLPALRRLRRNTCYPFAIGKL